LPIVVTPIGIVVATREGHSEKAPSPILVTPSGIVMAAREEHPQKAQSPIVVTESGIVMAAREEHPSKAPLPIDVTPFAKVTSVSSSLSLKFSTPEYTAELGISGKIEVAVLIALELGYGVNA
jgi:hypothetical protein